MPKTALPLVACLLALAAAGASAQSYWKWRDGSGQIHMGDTPPPSGIPAKDILQRPLGGTVPAPAATPAAPAGSAAAVDELQKKKAKADQEKAEKAAADKAAAEQKNAQIRADNCQRAQQAAQAYQSGVRVARLNAKGEREYMDDNARAAELKRMQDVMAQNCGPAPASGGSKPSEY
jgi:hypothetical protein